MKKNINLRIQACNFSKDKISNCEYHSGAMNDEHVRIVELCLRKFPIRNALERLEQDVSHLLWLKDPKEKRLMSSYQWLQTKTKMAIGRPKNAEEKKQDKAMWIIVGVSDIWTDRPNTSNR